jgi:hypothetical protein
MQQATQLVPAACSTALMACLLPPHLCCMQYGIAFHRSMPQDLVNQFNIGVLGAQVGGDQGLESNRV